MVWNPLSSTRSQRRGFTLVELLVVIAIIGLLVALLLPAVEATMESSRRNSCVNKARQLGVAVQTHHDAWRNFSAITTHPNGSVGSAAGATASGYSWIVRLLPYIEETNLNQSIVSRTPNFALAAFDSSIKLPSNLHVATASIKLLQCPSFDGCYSASSAMYPMTGSNKCGSTNYMAFAGSHVANQAIPINGGMQWGKPTKLAYITDCSSKTFVIAETKEQALSSWYDGSSCWVSADSGFDNLTPTYDGSQWGYSGTFASQYNTGPLGLNIGPGKENNDSVYWMLRTNYPKYPQSRGWGPSSDHLGIVVHVYADGHIGEITDEITPESYLSQSTRNGGETNK
jgi:prepilin-type N-terminal cleavage/methylation domain-containing protein